jgi:hypothetical protein
VSELPVFAAMTKSDFTDWAMSAMGRKRTS